MASLSSATQSASGAGASNWHHGYVARVLRWLQTRRKKVVVTLNAKGGVPVAYWEYTPMRNKLDTAVVELGTNDVRFGTPPAQFAQQYRTLTGRIRARNPNVQLLCLSVWSRPRRVSLESDINAQIRAVCPGAYVDITRLRYRLHIRSRDGFHPNDLGHHLIARAVESKLKRGRDLRPLHLRPTMERGRPRAPRTKPAAPARSGRA
jgi:hypothetical protein